MKTRFENVPHEERTEMRIEARRRMLETMARIGYWIEYGPEETDNEGIIMWNFGQAPEQTIDGVRKLISDCELLTFFFEGGAEFTYMVQDKKVVLDISKEHWANWYFSQLWDATCKGLA